MKYIIEIPDDVQYVLFNGQTDNKCYTAVRPVAELEVLNSDYINEHYGQMQDEAYKQGYADAERIWRAPSSDNEFYRKGLEDGKASIDKGCEGCKYESRTAIEEPCKYCSNCHTSKYVPMPKEDDRIEVGDIVDVYGNLGVVTYVCENSFDVMMYDGSAGGWQREDLKKTGKHYDIASILEAMRA